MLIQSRWLSGRIISSTIKRTFAAARIRVSLSYAERTVWFRTLLRIFSISLNSSASLLRSTLLDGFSISFENFKIEVENIKLNWSLKLRESSTNMEISKSQKGVVAVDERSLAGNSEGCVRLTQSKDRNTKNPRISPADEMVMTLSVISCLIDRFLKKSFLT